MNLQANTQGSPVTREQHGFARTVCGCAFCQAPCRHMPGSLDVDDLLRLCPPKEDVFAWAVQHLRALVDKGYPTLVPARGIDGACHWLFERRCAVHESAPYSCAYFDMHMTEAEIERRSAATISARQEDARRQGLYTRVWNYLCQRGLFGVAGNRAALIQEMEAVRVRELASNDHGPITRNGASNSSQK